MDANGSRFFGENIPPQFHSQGASIMRANKANHSMRLRNQYKRFREAGWHALQAMRAARILLAWNEAGDDVRIDCEGEQESYFDVYGEPKGYIGRYGRRVSAEQERKELCELIDRDGCWCVQTEYLDANGEWQHADSVGMCVGYNDPCSPYENEYVIDLMQSALHQRSDSLEDACRMAM